MFEGPNTGSLQGLRLTVLGRRVAEIKVHSIPGPEMSCHFGVMSYKLVGYTPKKVGDIQGPGKYTFEIIRAAFTDLTAM